MRAIMVALSLTPSGCAEEACPVCADPRAEGTVASAGLRELSGIAVATRIPDVAYAHNDSSDAARLFAMTLRGEDRGVIAVDGVDNEDWEDLAPGPCAAGRCLFIGDIGDNDRERSSYSIYVVEEPGALPVTEVEAQTVEFTYEDGPHDAEVLLVHPMTGVVTIVEKAEAGAAAIYELDALVPGRAAAARALGSVAPPEGSAAFTGGAIHPDGTGILLRTKTRLFHYPMAAEQSAAEALQGEPCRLPLAEEVQGEAVAWVDAEAFMTVGEGSAAAINVSSCGGGS